MVVVVFCLSSRSLDVGGAAYYKYLMKRTYSKGNGADLHVSQVEALVPFLLWALSFFLSSLPPSLPP